LGLERASALVGLLLLGGTLSGLVVRRRLALCYSFAAYLVAVLTGDLLILLWRERFFNWNFYVFKESVYVVLKFLVALELAAVVFQAFPGAAATARTVFLLTLGGILIGLLYAPGHGPDMVAIMTDLHPRISNGSAGLFVLILVLSIWYRIPLHDLHRAIARGFAAYLVIAAVAFHILGQIPGVERLSNWLDVGTYLTVLSYWAWSAWRQEATAPVSEDTLRRLQPWRDRL
jgi:hypothetical protein